MQKTGKLATDPAARCTYLPEFSGKAEGIIADYVALYNIDAGFPDVAEHIMIRHLLYSESVGYAYTEEQRDYYIKTSMGIIKRDEAYEKQIGYFGKSA